MIDNNEILSNASKDDKNDPQENNIIKSNNFDDKIVLNSDIKEEEIKQIIQEDDEEEKIATTFSNSNSSNKTMIFDPRNNFIIHENDNMSTSSSGTISNVFMNNINTQFYDRDRRWRTEETNELFNSTIKNINDFIDGNYESNDQYEYKTSKHMSGGINRGNFFNRF